MGTPEFAVPTLRALVRSGYHIVAVITAPDKPSGRGKKITSSAVKEASVQLGLPVLQPENLKDINFISQLKSFNASLQIVVAFRMLPEVVWAMPEMGTFNLHASLLPQYRGAAPINHVIINGEKETGLTTFFLDKEIDTGAIILQRSIRIEADETASSLHDKMMIKGAEMVLETVNLILEGKAQIESQADLISSNVILKKAPKINKEDCRINWFNEGTQIVNFIRGLSIYPAAVTEFISDSGEQLYLKIYNASFEKISHQKEIGEIFTDNNTYIKVSVKDGFVFLKELQQSGKKKLIVGTFLRGNNFSGNWTVKK